MNEAGQEFSGFRLLIEAAMVVLILVIIFSILSHLDNIRRDVSEKRLYEGFEKAAAAPDGSVIFEKGLVLGEGKGYSTRAFAKRVTDIEAECIEIRAGKSSAFSLEESSRIMVNSQVTADVYYKCNRTYDGADCHVLCTISFGEDLTGAE